MSSSGKISMALDEIIQQNKTAKTAHGEIENS